MRQIRPVARGGDAKHLRKIMDEMRLVEITCLLGKRGERRVGVPLKLLYCIIDAHQTREGLGRQAERSVKQPHHMARAVTHCGSERAHGQRAVRCEKVRLGTLRRGMELRLAIVTKQGGVNTCLLYTSGWCLPIRL